MAKQVDKLSFWKERIDTAVKDQYTVYVCSDQSWKEIMEEHTNIIEENIPSDALVLDAGCGYGRMCELFSPELYLGVDFSPDFINKAKNMYPDYQFSVENLKALPFKDNQFDWSFCVSIKKMIIDNLGEAEWQFMEDELKRVSKNVLLLEYEDPKPFEIL